MTPENADVRAYYTALDIALPDRPGVEMPVRCFASPDSHAHGDRRPSCSVNVASGAWKCNGCGAKGGAYDAALTLGYSPGAAIDLMIAHGLTTRRSPSTIRRHGRQGASAHVATATRRPTAARTGRPRMRAVRQQLQATERDVDRWARALRAHAPALRFLAERRGWSPTTLLALQVGLAGDRVTFPIRDATGELVGVQRYKPRRAAGEPKALNMPGTANGLFPHPASERARHLILVEGPPDALAARSRGLAAVAVPGVQSWQPEWSLLFAGRSVSVVLDCDAEGRSGAQRLSRELTGVALDVEVLDLAPEREDGFDLTDWLLERPGGVVPPSELRSLCMPCGSLTT